MRDYYNIYILMELHESNLNHDLLREAFIKTSTSRGTFENIKNYSSEYIQSIESSEVLLNLWERYRSNNEYASEISWEDTVSSMKRTFSKINLS